MSDKEFLQKVGFEIRIARLRSGMTGKEVAELSGMKAGALYELELGKRNSHILNYKRVADTLCIDLVKLLE